MSGKQAKAARRAAERAAAANAVMQSNAKTARHEETKIYASQVFDGFDNFVSRVGLQNNNTLSAGMYTFNLLTRNRIQLEAAYRGSWIVGQVIDTFADDMTRAGVDFTSSDSDEEIKDFQKYIVQRGIWTSLNEMIKWGRLYGGSISVLQIKGQSLASPLRVDSIQEGQFTGLSVYDRWQLNPDLTQIIEEGPNMGLPKYYYLVTTASTTTIGPEAVTGQIKIHHSRVIRNVGIKLPFFQAITEMMWGESLLERMWDRLIAFDTATMSTANLIERANNRTIGIENFRQIIASGGPALKGLMGQFDMMREFQTNEGMTLMDKEDTFATSNYTFAGLADVLIQFGQQISGAAKIPLVILFGQSPAGLNSTGDSDIRTYYDSINSQQNSTLRDPLSVLWSVMWRSKFGQPEPEDLGFDFVPLWQMSALDKATIAKSNTETVLGAEQQGVISRPTAMKELRDMSGDTGLFSNISDEEVEEAENEPAPDPEGVDPMNPGGDDPKSNEVVPIKDAKPSIRKMIKDWATKKKR